jgi:proline iminopeptidase
VFGGSWGSTLALAYAQTHPERVTELVLRGIFLLRRWEFRWFYQPTAPRAVPRPVGIRRGRSRKAERGDMMQAYLPRLTSDDRATRSRPRAPGRSGKARRATCA